MSGDGMDNITMIDVPVQGSKHDSDKPDWTLLPMSSVIKVIRVLEFGAKKYSRDQWRYVPDARRRYQAAAMRHLAAVIDGEWLDSESHEPHLAHLGCCVLFLLWFGDEVKT